MDQTAAKQEVRKILDTNRLSLRSPRASALTTRGDHGAPSAIVIGLDSITGLQTARVLARHKIPVVAIAKDATHYCCHTNTCERVLVVDWTSDELIAELERLGPSLEQKAVIIPCTDPAVLIVNEHRRRLEDHYHVVLPAAEVVTRLIDKVKLYDYARMIGLPIPRTFVVRSRVEVKETALQLRFPAVLKPAVKTPAWWEHTVDKVYKVADAGELLTVANRCLGWVDALSIQEWVQGGDDNLFGCYTYFNSDSEPVATFVARKIRQWPPEVGTGCAGVECRNDNVLSDSLRLFRSAGLRGIGHVEMKRDGRTGKHYIIDVHVGRTTGRSAHAEAAGVELLYAMYCDTIGWPLPPQLEQRYQGVKWMYWRRDLQSCIYHWRRGELTLNEWWRFWRSVRFDAVFSWSDPRPFLADLYQSISVIAGLGKKPGEWPRSRRLHARSHPR